LPSLDGALKEQHGEYRPEIPENPRKYADCVLLASILP
jgi:hypothetical protein